MITAYEHITHGTWRVKKSVHTRTEGNVVYIDFGATVSTDAYEGRPAKLPGGIVRCTSDIDGRPICTLLVHGQTKTLLNRNLAELLERL